MNNKLVTGVAIVALVLSGLSFFGVQDGVDGRNGRDGQDGRTGAQVGPDHDDVQYFAKNYYVGNQSTDYATTSDIAAVTLTSTELDCDQPYVSWTADLNTTLTVQASTTAPFSSMRVGQSCEVLIYSATTTAATTITFAEGTGIDLQYAEGTGGDAILNGQDIAKLTFVKKADTDVVLIFEEYTEAQ